MRIESTNNLSIMKRFIFNIVAICSVLLFVGCSKCDEPFCTNPKHNHTKSLIEMYVTSEGLGLDNIHLYTPYLKTKYEPIGDNYTGKFRMTYNLERKTGITYFSGHREELKYVAPDKIREARIDLQLLLPSDIPFELNKRYYFGELDGVNTDDGVVVPESTEKWYSCGIYLTFMGCWFESTYGWMMFTRLDEVSREENRTYSMLNMEFGFVGKDRGSEHTIIVEGGKIVDNPGSVIDENAKPSWSNSYQGAIYQDVVYTYTSVHNADEIAYMCMPYSEFDYMNPTTAEEVFARGTVVDLAPYKEGKGDEPYPVKLYYYIDGLEPDTEYMKFCAALNKASGLYALTYGKIKTQAVDGEEYKAFLWHLPSESTITANSATLKVLLHYADTLTYAICEGESYEGVEPTIPVTFDSLVSFVDVIYPVIEIENLKPNTTYTVVVEAKNRMFTTQKEITFTTESEVE